MLLDDLIEDADRQLRVCNACRYCEGYCAVFPAMERRREFEKGDVLYLANLCFECRACFYACPYTPPHEYAVNIPAVMSAVRTETYAEFTGPRLLNRLFRGNATLVTLTVGVLVALVFGSVLLIQGSSLVFSAQTGEGAFFEVVPYLAMVGPALALSAFWLAALLIGGARFWRSTGGSLRELLDLRAFARATKDAFGLEYLRGQGEGCTYPTSRFSQSRRYFHQALFWGVILDFASTSVAALYHNVLDIKPPYDYFSPPVVLGTAGGVLIVIGGAGLLWLKGRADPLPADKGMLVQDVAFLWLLLVTSVSGLVLLALRETAAMGTLLTVHLGIVAALFLMLPYGKFAHVVYRYAALIRNQVETKAEG
jgi:citrate/tricarballylate utilization protein